MEEVLLRLQLDAHRDSALSIQGHSINGLALFSNKADLDFWKSITVDWSFLSDNYNYIVYWRVMSCSEIMAAKVGNSKNLTEDIIR